MEDVSLFVDMLLMEKLSAAVLTMVGCILSRQQNVSVSQGHIPVIRYSVDDTYQPLRLFYILLLVII